MRSPDPNSVAGKVRAALAANPTATAHDLHAMVGGTLALVGDYVKKYRSKHGHKARVEALAAKNPNGLAARVKRICEEQPGIDFRRAALVLKANPATVQNYMIRLGFPTGRPAEQKRVDGRTHMDRGAYLLFGELVSQLRHSLCCVDTSCEVCLRIEEQLEQREWGDAAIIAALITHDAELRELAAAVVVAVDARRGPDRDRQVAVAATRLRASLTEGPSLRDLPVAERAHLLRALGAAPTVAAVADVGPSASVHDRGDPAGSLPAPASAPAATADAELAELRGEVARLTRQRDEARLSEMRAQRALEEARAA